MKLHALSITRWKHENPALKEPVHLCYQVDLSQLSFFQVIACEISVQIQTANFEMTAERNCEGDHRLMIQFG
jgi:hypothetical protein